MLEVHPGGDRSGALLRRHVGAGREDGEGDLEPRSAQRPRDRALPRRHRLGAAEMHQEWPQADSREPQTVPWHGDAPAAQIPGHVPGAVPVGGGATRAAGVRGCRAAPRLHKQEARDTGPIQRQAPDQHQLSQGALRHNETRELVREPRGRVRAERVLRRGHEDAVQRGPRRPSRLDPGIEAAAGLPEDQGPLRLRGHHDDGVGG
mmetsp:Transcript_123834/g.361574  ORF Transcript_123834/g.361574 Transcript_123834/m.361574 type:complete len:205 (+) Transcript_123834:1133-1747(+)